jgi:hypothetical protein
MRCKSQRGRAADRIADEDCALELQRVHRGTQQVLVMLGGGRCAVRRRKALARPVERNDLECIADKAHEIFEVARAMPDGVKTQDRFPAPAPHRRQTSTVDFDPGDRLLRTDSRAEIRVQLQWHVHASLHL